MRRCYMVVALKPSNNATFIFSRLRPGSPAVTSLRRFPKNQLGTHPSRILRRVG